MSQVRYSAKVISRAREHRMAGWSYPRIVGHLDREFGVRPSAEAVREWCMDPLKLRERRAESSNHRFCGRGKLAGRYTDAWKRRTIRELRDAGLSLSAIGVVAGVWWQEPLSEAQVRYRLRDQP